MQSRSSSEEHSNPTPVRPQSSSRLNEVSQILSNSCMEILQVPNNHLRDAFVGEQEDVKTSDQEVQWKHQKRGDGSNKAKR
mmetsp:Transcript_39307/g.60050  ORF Transcript_39307/g.60050 Transcript_39307/m.60050 type:complete len:81 (-) Transcript_39307:1050-1292(-)